MTYEKASDTEIANTIFPDDVKILFNIQIKRNN